MSTVTELHAHMCTGLLSWTFHLYKTVSHSHDTQYSPASKFINRDGRNVDLSQSPILQPVLVTCCTWLWQKSQCNCRAVSQLPPIPHYCTHHSQLHNSTVQVLCPAWLLFWCVKFGWKSLSTHSSIITCRNQVDVWYCKRILVLVSELWFQPFTGIDSQLQCYYRVLISS